MGRPAVPKYLDKHVLRHDKLEQSISPGLRFGLLFPFWRDTDWNPDAQDKSKPHALKQVLPLSDDSRRLLADLVDRQQVLADRAAGEVVQFQAFSTAPFMTGIGNEHPLENGFSFLNPYGLPYLPGSAVKGILRRAAENLASGAFGGNGGWQYPHLWLLFGFDASSTYLKGDRGTNRDPAVMELAQQQTEAFRDAIQRREWDVDGVRFFMSQVLPRERLSNYESDPMRLMEALLPAEQKAAGRKPVEIREIHFGGALSFWDVLPVPPIQDKRSDFLRIEILTPHYSDYYQKGLTPADCGQPIPNPFLTVAPGCSFTFFVHCATVRLPEPLKGQWKGLVQAAFHHAFDWLGFGAKTAVGYGQLSPLTDTALLQEEKCHSASLPPIPESQPPFAGTLEVWERATLSWKKNDQTLTATHADGRQKTAPIRIVDRSVVPESLHKPLFEPKKAKPVYARVSVMVQGNRITIEKIQAE